MSTTGFLVAVAIGFFAIAAVLLMAKPSYAVLIVGAGGENHAMTSMDQQAIQEIVDAIAEAIVGRG